jgi:hypothetical protein
MEAENPRAVAGGNNPPSIAEILAERHAKLFALVEPLAVRANALPKTIATDEDNLKLGEVVVDARAAAKQLEENRVAEKEPYLTGGREVDAAFKSSLDRLTKMADGLTQRASAYAHQKKMEERRRSEEEAKRLREQEEQQRRLADLEYDLGNDDVAAEHAGKAEGLAQRADTATTASTADLTRARGDNGRVATASDKWEFRVADWSKVDLDALRPFIQVAALEYAIKQHIRIHKGSKPIAGVEFVVGTRAQFR